MLETLALIAVVLAIAAAGILAYAARKPDNFAVHRSTSIAAPPERIYPLIADLKRMNTWNPFVEPDPNIKITYSGPESGTGAAHTWVGNKNVGEGSLRIVEDVPSSRIAMKLDMLKPMKALNDVEFTLKPNGNGTDVTWSMSGRQPFIGKVMTLFIDCDKMCGQQFEKGLASLKAIAEARVTA